MKKNTTHARHILSVPSILEKNRIDLKLVHGFFPGELLRTNKSRKQGVKFLFLTILTKFYRILKIIQEIFKKYFTNYSIKPT